MPDQRGRALAMLVVAAVLAALPLLLLLQIVEATIVAAIYGPAFSDAALSGSGGIGSVSAGFAEGFVELLLVQALVCPSYWLVRGALDRLTRARPTLDRLRVRHRGISRALWLVQAVALLVLVLVVGAGLDIGLASIAVAGAVLLVGLTLQLAVQLIISVVAAIAALRMRRSLL